MQLDAQTQVVIFEPHEIAWIWEKMLQRFGSNAAIRIDEKHVENPDLFWNTH